MRRNISSGSPFEPQIGFSRAVRIDNVIAVSGTAPVLPSGETAHPGDVYAQTRYCLKVALEAAQAAGGAANDVIRTRIMLTNIAVWQDAAKAHGELFGEVLPACTFVQVAGFIDPDWLVKIEMDLVVENG